MYLFHKAFYYSHGLCFPFKEVKVLEVSASFKGGGENLGEVAAGDGLIRDSLEAESVRFASKIWQSTDRKVRGRVEWKRPRFSGVTTRYVSITEMRDQALPKGRGGQLEL